MGGLACARIGPIVRHHVIIMCWWAMAAKVRTQIRLERRQYERLKRLAVERGQSLSGVLRALVDEVLGGSTAGPAAIREARLGFVGSGRDAEGKRDVARRHDRYLYGGRG